MRFSPGVAVQFLLPHKLSCRIVYRLSRSERPWLKNLLIRFFVRAFDVDLGDAETADALAYPSFNALFTRALRHDARPLAGGNATLASPVDGRLTEFGRLDGDRLLQAKGMSYTLGSLLVEQPDLLAPFANGSFMTIYLAPHNYHRVHTPIAGQLDRGRYIPGRRFAVNRKTAGAIDGVFTRNERVALWLSTEVGYAVVVMIGALNVASLSTVATGEIESGPERLFSPDPPGRLARGAELGRFNLGSTVVIAFPAGAVEWSDALVTGQSIRVGEAIGRLVDRRE
jgi:phosphatidylserine decarboxylase